MPASAESLKLQAVLREAGFTLEHHAEVSSTNSLAKEALKAGRDRHWIVADVQNAGRGRHQRGWISPAGNLHATLALADPSSPASLPLMGFVAGVALARAARTVAPTLSETARLKWPNDLLIAGKKASGILLEAAPNAAGGTGLVIGIGVNVIAAPEGLDQPATAIAEHARGISRDVLFAALASELAAALALFARGAGFAALRDEWLRLALPLGQPLRIKLPDGAREGRFAGIDASGALLLQTDAGLVTILAGDVFAL